MLAPEHPQRLALANEIHARPSETLGTPCRATYVAMLVEHRDRDRELSHLTDLCERFSVESPAPGSTHFSARMGSLKIKWERHGEFSGYTFVAAGISAEPFSEPPTFLLPAGWLAKIPGHTLIAAHAKIISSSTMTVDSAFLARHFGENQVIGGDVGGSAGEAYSDFQIHPDGFSRFLLVDSGFTPRQAGRMMQRLFEIEAYRMMALLALPIARRQSIHMAEIEVALSALTAELASGSGDDEDLLQKVTRLAAEVESGLANSQFRFGACAAYAELVHTRIAELRERRLPGIQPIGEFMARRFTPAVATCATVSQRLLGASERVARASALLSTRVDIARERQNQALLGSMDRRAKAQLRLQETIEGLSVAAIVYYAAGLVGYVAKAFKSRGFAIEPDFIVGSAIPLMMLVVLVVTRRARRKVRDDVREQD
jgi:uncharacterized membrane-anchored protein